MIEEPKTIGELFPEREYNIPYFLLWQYWHYKFEPIEDEI